MCVCVCVCVSYPRQPPSPPNLESCNGSDEMCIGLLSLKNAVIDSSLEVRNTNIRDCAAV